MTDLTCLGDDLPERWWRDERALRHERAAHQTLKAAAVVHGVKPNTVQKGWQDTIGEKLPPGPRSAKRERGDVSAPVRGQEPGLHVDFTRGRATLVTDPQDVRENPDLGDAETLVRERGLDPDEWLVERVKVNEWQGFYKKPRRDLNGDFTFDTEVVTLRQLVATLRRKPPLELIFPAVEVRERKPPKSTRSTAARLVVCVGDQQADYHDEKLHRAFLRWAAEVQPREVVMLGDTADFPTISRHPDRPFWNSTPQRCINEAYRLLSEYRDVLPDARMRKLRGNHDWRLESETLTRAERTFGLAPAPLDGVDQVPGHSIRRLLHLDALHVELVGREGDKWELAETQIAPGVWARHQPPNLKKHLRLNRDVIAGDTHRQSIRQVTVFNDQDEPVVRTLVEAGCMCRTDGLGYTEHPDWQPGFVTVAIGADGSPSYDLATWRNERLAWRGDTWRA